MSGELDLGSKTKPWTRFAIAVLAVLITSGLALRLIGLSVEGFADDEVHKWLAINRYLTFDLVGDDVEHPMLMKWLMTGALLIGRELGWAPEMIVRLPNVLFGAATIYVVALLGRRLFGQTAALVAASVVAYSPTMIGYQRIAKEDTLLGFFLMLVLLCLCEAKVAAEESRAKDQTRWEWWAAVSLGLMFASKYFFHFAFIPVLVYAWLRRTDTRYHVPLKRWGRLIAGAVVVFAAVNWTPFMPSTWAYGLQYVQEKPAIATQTVHGSLFFMGTIYNNLPSFWLKGTAPWFYVVFFFVKLAPPTVLAASIGLVLALKERKPSHRVVLAWMGVWFLVFSVSGAKWGRFFQTVLPAFALLAGHAVDRALVYFERVRATKPGLAQMKLAGTLAAAALVVPLVATEAVAAIEHAPRYRLYISALGGGDRNIQWFFPHCDYYDSGFREAIKYVAEHAEPGAELSTEIDWVAQYYAADVYGRKDLVHSVPRKGTACTNAAICYVVVQSGRWYLKNKEAVDYLSKKEPVYVERFGGQDVVRVYRLENGDRPYAEDRLGHAALTP